MITAEEARKISESYDDGILEEIEVKIKDAAKRGYRSVSVDSVGINRQKLKDMGYIVDCWSKYNESGYTIIW